MAECKRSWYPTESSAKAKIAKIAKTRTKYAKYESQKGHTSNRKYTWEYCVQCQGWHVTPSASLKARA